MATTVANIISSARYDLRDFGGQKFDDAQLVDYVNRIIQILDSLLLSRNSDFVHTSESVALSSGEHTATAPTRCVNILMLYYGSIKLTQKSLAFISDRYNANNDTSSTGTPSYWAQNANNINFDIEADDDYTLTAYYQIKTATLTSVDNLPYYDFFNEYIREALVMMAMKAREDKAVKMDAEFWNMFKRVVDGVVIGRNFVPKNYHLGF